MVKATVTGTDCGVQHITILAESENAVVCKVETALKRIEVNCYSDNGLYIVPYGSLGMGDEVQFTGLPDGLWHVEATEHKYGVIVTLWRDTEELKLMPLTRIPQEVGTC